MIVDEANQFKCMKQRQNKLSIQIIFKGCERYVPLTAQATMKRRARNIYQLCS